MKPDINIIKILSANRSNLQSYLDSVIKAKHKTKSELQSLESQEKMFDKEVAKAEATLTASAPDWRELLTKDHWDNY